MNILDAFNSLSKESEAKPVEFRDERADIEITKEQLEESKENQVALSERSKISMDGVKANTEAPYKHKPDPKKLKVKKKHTSVESALDARVLKGAPLETNQDTTPGAAAPKKGLTEAQKKQFKMFFKRGRA